MFSLSAVINPIKLRSCGPPYNRWRQSFPQDQLNHQEITICLIVYHNKNHIENLFNKHLSGKHDLGDDTRPRDFLLVDIVFISIRGRSYSDCQFHRVFVVNISVGLMIGYQNLTVVGEGLTVASFSILTWWTWHWCGTDRWREWIGRSILLQFSGSGGLNL